MTMQAETETRDAWTAIAEGYDDVVTPTHMWLGGEALRLSGVGAGTRFLDVAAGSGALSIPAARLGARVVSIDISATMLDRLSARAAREQLDGVTVRVMDGHALDFDDGSFDVAGSQYGVMLFPDLPRALGEMSRVTRPGGQVFLVVYGPPTQVEFLAFFMGAMQAVVPGFTGLPLDPPPLPFQVADPAKLHQALVGAGLESVRVETITETLEFTSAQQMWNWVTNSNPIGAMLVADLRDEQAAAVRHALDGMLEERAGVSGVARLTNPVHIGVGTVRGA